MQGTFIGAVTLTGSAVAFGKLHGIMASAPLNLPGKNVANLSMAAGTVASGAAFLTTGDPVVGLVSPEADFSPVDRVSDAHASGCIRSVKILLMLLLSKSAVSIFRNGQVLPISGSALLACSLSEQLRYANCLGSYCRHTLTKF